MNRIKFLYILLIATNVLQGQAIMDPYGALVRSDTLEKKIYLCFTGHDLFEGFDFVLSVLTEQEIRASFFLTGDFIRNHSTLVKDLIKTGHYVGAHSDRHLLYNDWTKRDSLLFNIEAIKRDISMNLNELKKLNIDPNYFMPPYEWYNLKIVEIARDLGQITVNYTPGTRSNADYTTPDMLNYLSSEVILKSIFDYEKWHGLNGFHLLIHPGTSPHYIFI